MTVFMIPPESITALREAVTKARAHPTPWEALRAAVVANDTDVVTLADRGGLPKIQKWIETVVLPFDWRVAISCEEQPAAILLHVSMSSPKKGKVPTPEAMMMLVDAIGFDWDDIARAWIEEFDPGHMAVNALIVLEERAGGHA
jgi:hypothetical protein